VPLMPRGGSDWAKPHGDPNSTMSRQQVARCVRMPSGDFMDKFMRDMC
jgi:hypothetical protein